MKNGKPSNLFPLIKAVRHPFGKHQKAYERYFCAGREKSFGRGRVVWDANGSSNLAELRKHTSSHLLHMTKEQCLADLPQQTRKFREVPVSSRHQLRHNQALQHLVSRQLFWDVSTCVIERAKRVDSVTMCTVNLLGMAVQAVPSPTQSNSIQAQATA